ncbi:hypothetical protein NQZ68_011160 [Dissostichus eleginoides]|nr:hypothetical protein NQZ68_011160 [Dissostichus eleginoides]
MRSLTHSKTKCPCSTSSLHQGTPEEQNKETEDETSQISHAPPLRREESCDRKQQIRPPQPSKLHLFTASKTSASSGSKVKPAPPALSRLPKPKSH